MLVVVSGVIVSGNNEINALTGGVIAVVVSEVFRFSESGFVVMHPDLENAFVDANLVAEPDDKFFVAFLHLPPDSFRDFVHLFLLILSEFRSKSFFSVRVGPRAGRSGDRGVVNLEVVFGGWG